MPVKTSTATENKTETPKTEVLDSVTLKTISKLSPKLAASAKGMKLAQESARKSTFKLFADFREAAREGFKDLDEKMQRKAGRSLAVNVLATVFDIPIKAINLRGHNPDVWVHGAKTVNKKGKEIDNPEAGEEISAEDYAALSEEQQKYIIHPTVDGAARQYQFATKLVNVAFPDDKQAKELVDEALDEDGTCKVTEDVLNKLAAGTLREIKQKGSHGGTREKIVFDKKKFTEELTKLAKKAWDGGGLIPGYKGKLEVEELTEACSAVMASLEAELETHAKAAKKNAGKETAENTDEE